MEWGELLCHYFRAQWVNLPSSEIKVHRHYLAQFNLFKLYRGQTNRVIHFFLKMVTPRMAVNTTKKRNTKKIILAMEASPAAIPANPKSAATIAITKNMAVHLSRVLCVYHSLFTNV